MAKQNKQAQKNKRSTSNRTKGNNCLDLRKRFVFVFTLIAIGFLLRCVPRLSATMWYGVVGWGSFYLASTVLAFSSRAMGKRYGTNHIVVGVTAIAFALLFCESNKIPHYLKKVYASLCETDNLIFLLEILCLLFVILGSWAIVIGVLNFLQDFIIQWKKNRKSRRGEVENDIDVNDINAYLGLLSVVLEIVYFFVEKYA